MAAFVIGHITVRDADKWQIYVARVGATIVAHGGEILFRGEKRALFNGKHDCERVVVLKFADPAAAQRWHDSPEYQTLIPLRDAGADVTLISYQA
ncbi:MAG: DUF1330 domain-containing protein [Burkholderiales bacterium]